MERQDKDEAPDAGRKARMKASRKTRPTFRSHSTEDERGLNKGSGWGRQDCEGRETTVCVCRPMLLV